MMTALVNPISSISLTHRVLRLSEATLSQRQWHYWRTALTRELLSLSLRFAARSTLCITNHDCCNSVGHCVQAINVILQKNVKFVFLALHLSHSIYRFVKNKSLLSCNIMFFSLCTSIGDSMWVQNRSCQNRIFVQDYFFKDLSFLVVWMSFFLLAAAETIWKVIYN